MQHKAILTTVLESGGTAASRQPGQGASPGGGVPGEGEAGDHGGGRGRSEPRTERSHCPPLVSRGRREPQVVPLPLWTGHRTWPSSATVIVVMAPGLPSIMQTHNITRRDTLFICLDRMSNMKCQILRKSHENVNRQMVEVPR